MKTYLIQRAEIKDRDYKKGIDSIIELEYMGAAEFEWGAVPESLSRIRENEPDYTYLDVPIFGKTITVFCPNGLKPEIRGFLKDLGNDEINLKERSCFNDYVNPSEVQKKWQSKRPLRTNFWWDLDNDVMFWAKNNEFELKFKTIIPHKPK